MFVPEDAEVILRHISSVQRYKAVGSKEQQENQDRMLSSNADEDKYHTFLLIWQRPERSLKGDSMPARGVIQYEERERAFSDKSSERILGKSEAVCRWKHDGLLDPGRDKRGGDLEPSSASSSSNRAAKIFDEIPPRDRNRFSAARMH